MGTPEAFPPRREDGRQNPLSPEWAPDLCRCGEEAADDLGGLCGRCYDGENGPRSDDYLYRDNSEPAFVRQNIIDAGRGHLVL